MKVLYKYTEAKNFESCIDGGGRIKLSFPAKDFKDIFDCAFVATKENYGKSFKMLSNAAFVCEFEKESENKNNKVAKKCMEIQRMMMKSFHKYEDNQVLNAIISSYVSKRPKLNKTMKQKKSEFNSTFKNVIEDIKQNALVGSLTKCFDNILMWDRYGDGHKGICVEYELMDDVAQEVIYTEDENSFDLYNILKYIIPAKYFKYDFVPEKNEECLKLCTSPFLKKMKNYSFEEESRILFNVKNTEEIIFDEELKLWFYPNVRVKSIYLGVNVDIARKEEMIKKCKDQGIIIYQMKKNGDKRLLQCDLLV